MLRGGKIGLKAEEDNFVDTLTYCNMNGETESLVNQELLMDCCFLPGERLE